MALSSKIKVPLPSKGITVRGTGKYRYVYKVISTFRNESGQPDNIRRAIGRLDEQSNMMIPNDAYWEYYGNTHSFSDFLISTTEPLFEGVRSIGASYLIGQILGSLRIPDILKDVFGANRASAIKAVGTYMVCRGNVLESVADWCEGYTYKEPLLTSPGTTSLFASITYEERMAFFGAWVKLQPDNEYYAYDVTSFSSYATGIAETEWGYNRDKEKLPQINFGCYLGQKSGLPVFYVTYPGSIVDKSHLKYMMAYNESLGISNACFVMDRGFCKTDNIIYMHSAHLSYIIGVESWHKTIRAAINDVRDKILSMRHLVKTGVYARSVRSRFYGASSTLHIFYDPSMAEDQRRDLYRTVEVDEEKLCQLKQLTKKEAKLVTLKENHTIKKQKSKINAHRKYTTRNPVFIGFIWWEFIIEIKMTKMMGQHRFLLVNR